MKNIIPVLQLLILLFIAGYILFHPALLLIVNLCTIPITVLLYIFAIKWDIALKYIKSYGNALAGIFMLSVGCLVNDIPVENMDIMKLSMYSGLEESTLLLDLLALSILIGAINLFLLSTLKDVYARRISATIDQLESLKNKF